MTTTANGRTADYPIDPKFLERWSPRAFTGEVISETDLMTILEAARWAPSSYNSQPWRFVYARRDTPHWEKLLGLLIPFNQSWAKQAGALVIIVSNSLMTTPSDDKPVPSHSHSFDTGAAWAYMALEAQRIGWHTHGMVGFDIPRAFAELDVPEGHRVEAAVAIGRQCDKSVLPEALQAREVPSPRKPISESVFEGGFKKG
jgi:nitroreductase